MPAELTALAVREFGVTIDRHAGRPADARSGSGLYRARTPDGQAAYLKITPAGLGAGTLRGAHRELRFYRQLAAEVPVRTPPLLDALETGLGVALLLDDAGGQVDTGAWTDAAWSALGRDLAGLHAVPVDTQDWSRPDTVLDAMSGLVSDAISGFWGDVLPGLAHLLASRDALRAELASQPAVFVHGDCHTGNIVHAADGLTFCDWQSAGAGRATSDLAFLGVRAAPAGVWVPREVMTAYLNGRGGDFDQLERARADPGGTGDLRIPLAAVRRLQQPGRDRASARARSLPQREVVRAVPVAIPPRQGTVRESRSR